VKYSTWEAKQRLTPVIPVTQEAEIREIAVQVHGGQNVNRTPKPNVYACDPSYAGGVCRRTAGPGKTQAPIQKITIAKRPEAWLKW
jgi:hypothetical protein